MAFKAGAGLGPVTLISCVTDRIDAFVVGTDGGVYTSALWSGATAWTIWTRIGYSQAAPCAPITAVSTASGMIDLFFVDTSGRVITASTNYPVGTHLASFSWGSEVPDPQGLNLKTTLHAPITVVDLVGGGLVLLLFAVGLDGRVHMNMRWGGTWAGWSALGENILVDQLALVLAPPGAPIAAASIRRSDNWELELFVVGNDSFIYWNAVKSGLNWRGWKKLDGAPLIAPRTPITGIWRNTNYLDIFFTDGTAKVVKTARLLSTTTFPFVDRSSFKTALGSVIPARTPVTAVSMAPDRIDIFAIDDEGRVVWNGNSPGQSWTSNAFRVVNTDMFTQPAIAVGAVSRALYKLDVAVPRTTDGFVVTAAWELKDLWTGFRGWSQIGSLQTGMRDPRLGLWLRRAVINAWIGTEGSEEAQGVTTDDVGHWFLTSNHNCDGNYQSVRRYDRYFGLLQKWYLGDVHPGAADCFDGKIFVPLEYYSYQGIWKAHWSFTDRSRVQIQPEHFLIA